VNQLIIDYIVICDKRGEILEFADFIPLWLAAHQRAEEHVRARVRQHSQVAERHKLKVF
jgi:hypothetical protein